MRTDSNAFWETHTRAHGAQQTVCLPVLQSHIPGSNTLGSERLDLWPLKNDFALFEYNGTQDVGTLKPDGVRKMFREAAARCF